MKPLLILGMFGLGDNIHARAVVRQLMKRSQRPLFLQSPWPSVYRDLVGEQLAMVPSNTSLRTQKKNEQREAGEFAYLPRDRDQVRINYTPSGWAQHGSTLGAMIASCGLDKEQFDFSLPVPLDWRNGTRYSAIRGILAQAAGKPIMFYRPLVGRREWGGHVTRNPDAASYLELLMMVRAQYFVVSIADLVPGEEWLTGTPVAADLELHAGELVFEELAALAAVSTLIFSSPGFAIPLAQAVGVPSVCVFGGYEDGRSFSLGARLAPHLPIEPIVPCPCWRHDHACIKDIDMAKARGNLESFNALITSRAASFAQHRPH